LAVEDDRVDEVGDEASESVSAWEIPHPVPTDRKSPRQTAVETRYANRPAILTSIMVATLVVGSAGSGGNAGT
jgi:hypothetical protein